MIIRIVLRGLTRMFGRPAARDDARARPAGPRGPRSAAARPIEDLVLDPVCRTYFPRSTAVAARVAGREELFCSNACRDKALAAVARAS